MTLRALVLAAAVLTLPTVARAEDWHRFRGPGGSGISTEKDVPVQWGNETNIAWKVPTAGYGAAEPVVFGDRIFLACYSDYGQGRDGGGRPEDMVYHLVCLDRADGSTVWDAEVPSVDGIMAYRGFLALHGYASATPYVTEDAIYCFFANTGVFAFDHDGNKLWGTNVGNKMHGWGPGPSPIVYKGVVIVNASIESDSLVGLDAKTGEQLWRQGGIEQAWSTPALVEAGGRTEVVVSAKGKLAAFDPEKGTPLWTAKGIPDYICPTPATKDGVVYIIGGRRGMGMAVKAGGSGDVTDSHVLWTCDIGSNVTSPTLYEGHLYWFADSGREAYCVNAASGEIVYRERLNPKADTTYGSATVADGRIYVTDRSGTTFVLAARPEFELLARNTLEDGSVFNASPVVSEGQFLLRSDTFLYCIGK